SESVICGQVFPITLSKRNLSYMLGNPDGWAPVLRLVKVENPRPCPNSCKRAATTSKLLAGLLAGLLPSKPKYQLVFAKQSGLPTLTFKITVMSAVLGSRSAPAK